MRLMLLLAIMILVGRGCFAGNWLTGSFDDCVFRIVVYHVLGRLLYFPYLSCFLLLSEKLFGWMLVIHMLFLVH